MPDLKQVDIAEMAQVLKTKKSLQNRMVLLLGTRAGGLFRSDDFYETLAPFSKHDFRNLTQIEQFAKCYKLLTQRQFSETDIYSLLRTALQKVSITTADHCLAELIKYEYFDEIISTNIDDLLEQAFSWVGMQELRDFDVLSSEQGIRHSDRSTSLHKPRGLRCRLNKVFGDLASREYNINKDSFHFDRSPALKDLLNNLLKRDILVVGLDPVWDEALLRAFPEDAEHMWFVNEEDLTAHPTISSILQNRRTFLFKGHRARYEHFFIALHGQLKDEIPEVDQYHQTVQDIHTELRNLRNGQREIHKVLASLKERVSELMDAQNKDKP